MTRHGEGGLHWRGGRDVSITVLFTYLPVWRQSGARGKIPGRPTMAAGHGGGTPAATPVA